jgi:hypothetical protein
MALHLLIYCRIYMDNNDSIPPLIQSKISFKSAAKPEAPSGFQRIAQVSLWMPICAWLLCRVLGYSLKSMTPGTAVLVSLAAAGITLLLCCLSNVLGIIALFGIPKHGTQGILWRALGGMAASGAILFLMGAGFVHGYQTAVRARSTVLALRPSVQETHDDSKKATDGSATPATTQAQADKSKSASETSSQAWPVDTSLSAKATSHFQRELQSLSKDYAEAAQQLRNPWVLDIGTLDKREELAIRKDTVQKFMASNEKFLAFVMNGEKHYRDDLARFDIPEEVCEGALKTYRRSTEEWNFLTLKARQSDQQIGTALLGMLDTLDAGWGKWKYSPENKTAIFADNALVAKYNAYFKAMQSAHTDQKQTLAQLSNLPPTRFTDVMQTAQR